MQWFRDNTTLKLLSLLLGIIVWLFVKALTIEPRPPSQTHTGLFHQLGLVGVAQLTERELPVHLAFTGKLPSGFIIERTNVVPRTVRVKGPKSVLTSLRAIETLPVDLTDRRISFRERVDLVPPDTRIALVSHARADADVRIREVNR
ncbi:MAG: YbbR-like domain-containing protein [Verrucomicrobia bacterium]|nr:YbbR-like domain-containing protein [Verrucomicrobiota bacterium]